MHVCMIHMSMTTDPACMCAYKMHACMMHISMTTDPACMCAYMMHVCMMHVFMTPWSCLYMCIYDASMYDAHTYDACILLFKIKSQHVSQNRRPLGRVSP